MQLTRRPGGNLALAVPILGLDERLATAVVAFEPEACPCREAGRRRLRQTGL